MAWSTASLKRRRTDGRAFRYAVWQLPASRMAVRRTSRQSSRSPSVVSSSPPGRLLRDADAVLLRLQKVERDRVRVEGLQEFASLVEELGHRLLSQQQKHC